MRLAFRQRILLILICLGAVPTAVAILGWALTVRSTTPAAGALRAMEEVGASGRTLLQTLDSHRAAAGRAPRARTITPRSSTVRSRGFSG